MKRFLFMLLLMLLILPLKAERVTRQRALEVANLFFQRNEPVTRGATSSLELVWDGEDGPLTRGVAENPAYYVFSRKGGGFVIVSADDRIRSILGFSFENEFCAEAMPSNVKWYMDYLKSYCRGTSTPDFNVALDWSSYSATKVFYPEDVDFGSEYNDVRTNQWGQSYPFFNKVPAVYGNRCQAGCLPVALAEILTFFASQKDEYKVTGDGSTVGGYDMGGAYVEPYSLNSVYRWDDFKDAHLPYSAGYLCDAAIESLSQLVLDCGTLLKASYSVYGTAASELDVIHAFGDHMGYNKAARFERPEHYTKSQWLKMLKDEMDAGRPLLYCGMSDDGGHAFVADGYATYDDELVIHFNFGWDGADNGYYYYPHITPKTYDFYPSNTGEYRFDGLYLKATADTYKGVGVVCQGYINYYWVGVFGIKTLSSFSGDAEVSIVDKNGNYLLKGVSKNFQNLTSGNNAEYMTYYFTLNPYFGHKGIYKIYKTNAISYCSNEYSLPSGSYKNLDSKV